ncbi:MAG: hypothetical protein JO122_21040 [Acetobacteraceae bacterium]|nr:hypothetical protein [Acetobacteraceae bacterium]
MTRAIGRRSAALFQDIDHADWLTLAPMGLSWLLLTTSGIKVTLRGTPPGKADRA